MQSPEHDIRLGDLFIEVRGNGECGVLQDDFGKIVHGENFTSTGFFSPPPRSLLGAVQELDKQYTIKGHKIEEVVDEVPRNHPWLRREFGRPDLARD